MRHTRAGRYPNGSVAYYSGEIVAIRHSQVTP